MNASNGVRVIIDGLLCSIVKAISRFPNDHEFVNIIETAIVETEVKEAWVKLFSYFNDVLDEVRKIPIIEIRRQSKRLMIEDMVKLIRRKDLLSDCHIFVLPWFYNINPFVTENQRIGGIWQKETVVETEKRFNDLESRIEARLEQKHRDLMANLKIWSDNVIKTVLLSKTIVLLLLVIQAMVLSPQLVMLVQISKLVTTISCLLIFHLLVVRAKEEPHQFLLCLALNLEAELVV